MSRSRAPLPPGSEAVSSWAASQYLEYDARPDEAWFRAWEPHDTIAPPTAFFNACTWNANPGSVVLVEPWYAEPELEPLERALLAFASHPTLRRHASMRVGEYFLTRVAYLESAPPPTVHIGDKRWDEHVTTLAASPREADEAFHPALRKLLGDHGFRGQIELRPGGAVIFGAGLRPDPRGYERLFNMARSIVSTAAGG